MSIVDLGWFFTGWPRSLEGVGAIGVTVMRYAMASGTASKLPHLDSPHVEFDWGIPSEGANELARSLISVTYWTDEMPDNAVEAVAFGVVELFPFDGTWAISDLRVRQVADRFMIPWLRDRL